jgi:hypothetical protein
MLRHFRSSPLWLIGLFIVFAEATAGLAAVRIGGWPQGALVIFVIAYSTVVTAVFFGFLWFKPENFYGPSEYGDISPESYANALKRVPQETAAAVSRLEDNPYDRDALFALLDKLLPEDVKQHMILMRKSGDSLDVSERDDEGFTHEYRFITRAQGFSSGIFAPGPFLRKIEGTDLVRVSGSGDKLMLTGRGKNFSEWLIKHQKDAETFESDKGRWGIEQDFGEAIRKIFAGRKESRSDTD